MKIEDQLVFLAGALKYQIALSIKQGIGNDEKRESTLKTLENTFAEAGFPADQ